MRETLIAAYLDFRNNYLTVEKYAEHNGLTEEQARKLIDLARDVFSSDHPRSLATSPPRVGIFTPCRQGV
jgi:hypothetical protein